MVATKVHTFEESGPQCKVEPLALTQGTVWAMEEKVLLTRWLFPLRHEQVDMILPLVEVCASRESWSCLPCTRERERSSMAVGYRLGMLGPLTHSRQPPNPWHQVITSLALGGEVWGKLQAHLHCKLLSKFLLRS